MPDLRLAGIPLASWLDAAPDMALAGGFAAAVMHPAGIGAGGLRWLLAVMLIEFIVIHSSPFAASVMLARWARWLRLLATLGLAVFYIGFVMLAAAFSGSGQPLLTFALLTLNRLGFVLLRDSRSLPTVEQREIRCHWQYGAAGFFFALLIAAVAAHWGAAWLPVTRVASPASLPPELRGAFPALMLAGVLYFGFQAVRALFFSRPIGAPGYTRPVADRVAWGIHADLWYLAKRQLFAAGMNALVLGLFLCLTIWVKSPGGIVAVSLFGAAYLALIAGIQAGNLGWLRRATAMLARPPARLRVRIENDPRVTRHVTRVTLTESGASEPYTIDVEPVWRWHVLPRGAVEFDAEVYSDFRRHAPTVIRAGATCLCSRLPMPLLSEDAAAEDEERRDGRR